jgi:tetratricopeptide (TPR) repeat protein
MIKKGLYILAFMLSCFILKAQEEVHQDSLQLHIKSLKQFKNYRSYLQHDLVSCRPRVTYLQFLQTVYNYSKKLDQEEHLITLKALNNSATIKQHFFEGTKYALEYLAHDEVYEKEESFGVLRNLTFCLSSLGLHTEYLFWIEKMNIQSQKFNQNYWTPENPFTLELGTIYYKVGNYKEAIALKKLYPDTDYVRTAGIYNNVGMCYTKMNQKDSAYFYFDKAMDILKNNPIKKSKKYILSLQSL